MSKDILLVLLGTALALVSGLIGAFVQHRFSLRSDSIIRKRNLAEKDATELAERLPEEVRSFVTTLCKRSSIPAIEEFRQQVYLSLLMRLKYLLSSGLLTTVQASRLQGELARLEFLKAHADELGINEQEQSNPDSEGEDKAKDGLA